MQRIAIVTGGAQGVGRGCVERLAGEGWRVAALDADGEALAELRAEQDPGAVLALEADVADEAAIAGAFAALARWSDGPGLDLLVNNAGIADPFTGPVEALSLEAWRRRIDVNLTGAFLCARAAVPGLRARRGAIVNIASTRAFQSEPHCEAYAAAKGGLVALTHALAVSLGPEIRVNAVAPGWIEVRDRAKASRRTAPEQGEADRAFHPVGRIGSPEDVAALVAWLTSGEAGFMTGQTLALDGGVSRRMVWPE